MSYKITLSKFGNNAVIISWGNNFNLEISNDVHSFNNTLTHLKPSFIIETVPCYNSLTVFHDSSISQFDIISQLKQVYASLETNHFLQSKIWKIHVCYHQDYAPDLANLAFDKNLTIEDVIKLHCDEVYTVEFLGFLPGFPYLSGLKPCLHTSRLSKPRQKVAKGSIAIGGKQTGIYPRESPAGWHIIGRTNFELFNPSMSRPCSIKPLDKIQFEPVSKKEFES